MTGSGSRGKSGARHYYYHGNARTGCSERIRADKLEELIIHELRQIKPSRSVLDFYLEVLTDFALTGKKIEHQNRINTKQQIITLKEKLNSLEEKYLFDGLAQDTYAKWKAKLEGEIRELKDTTADTHDTISKQTINNVTSSLPLITNLDDYFERGTSTYKKDLLCSIIEGKISVLDKTLDRTPFHPIIKELSTYRVINQNTPEKTPMVPPQEKAGFFVFP